MDRLEQIMRLFYPTIEYKDAELRADAADKFFRDVLEIKHVEVLRNLSRDEIL